MPQRDRSGDACRGLWQPARCIDQRGLAAQRQRDWRRPALDWLVCLEPFVDKHVAVLNASPRTHHADAALRETLNAMSAVIAEAASISIPLLGSHRSDEEMAGDPMVAAALRGSLPALRDAVVDASRALRAPDAY